MTEVVEMVEAGGNTISPAKCEKNSEKSVKRISASKSWCGTHNNYSSFDLVEMVEHFKSFDLEYVIGEEVGDQGTPHLQFYVRSKTCFRPMEKFKLSFKPHWEKCKGNHMENVAYCTKEGKYKTNLKVPKPLFCPTPYGWQTSVVITEIQKDIPVDVPMEVPETFWTPGKY